MVNNADMVGMVSRDGDDEVMIGGRECGEQKERGGGRECGEQKERGWVHEDDDVVRGNGKNQVSEKMENGPELYSRKKSE